MGSATPLTGVGIVADAVLCSASPKRIAGDEVGRTKLIKTGFLEQSMESASGMGVTKGRAHPITASCSLIQSMLGSSTDGLYEFLLYSNNFC